MLIISLRGFKASATWLEGDGEWVSEDGDLASRLNETVPEGVNPFSAPEPDEALAAAKKQFGRDLKVVLPQRL
jgi:hypothetical protein